MSDATKSLFSKDDHSLILIDHQSLQTLSTRSHEVDYVVNNAVAVAEVGNIFDLPRLVTTGFLDRQGIVEPLDEAVRDWLNIERPPGGFNAWDNQEIRQWARDQGRNRLVMAGQWTEICLSFTVLAAIDDGYEVAFIADASGGATKEAHDIAVERMIQAGAIPMTAFQYAAEVLEDWGREDGLGQPVNELYRRRSGAFGQGLIWQAYAAARAERAAA